jgi:hypothetical protein
VREKKNVGNKTTAEEILEKLRKSILLFVVADINFVIRRKAYIISSYIFFDLKIFSAFDILEEKTTF